VAKYDILSTRVSGTELICTFRFRAYSTGGGVGLNDVTITLDDGRASPSSGRRRARRSRSPNTTRYACLDDRSRRQHLLARSWCPGSSQGRAVAEVGNGEAGASITEGSSAIPLAAIRKREAQSGAAGPARVDWRAGNLICADSSIILRSHRDALRFASTFKKEGEMSTLNQLKFEILHGAGSDGPSIQKCHLKGTGFTSGAHVTQIKLDLGSGGVADYTPLSTSVKSATKLVCRFVFNADSKSGGGVGLGDVTITVDDGTGVTIQQTTPCTVIEEP
jgi:hypothetical protein